MSRAADAVVDASHRLGARAAHEPEPSGETPCQMAGRAPWTFPAKSDHSAWRDGGLRDRGTRTPSSGSSMALAGCRGPALSSRWNQSRLIYSSVEVAVHWQHHSVLSSKRMARIKSEVLTIRTTPKVKALLKS